MMQYTKVREQMMTVVSSIKFEVTIEMPKVFQGHIIKEMQSGLSYDIETEIER